MSVQHRQHGRDEYRTDLERPVLSRRKRDRVHFFKSKEQIPEVKTGPDHPRIK